MKIQIEGITGSTLKLVAIITMVFDHIAAIILERMLIQQGMLEAVDEQAFSIFLDENQGLYYTYVAFKIVGRIAFPIFCFLLVQGLLHTRNLKKYLSRLILFALISEIPFDLGFYGVPFYWQHQNVFFTLFLGVLAVAVMEKIQDKKEWNVIWRIFLCLLTVGACMCVAGFLETDYTISGILAIVAIYLFRSMKTLSVGVGCILLNSIPAFISLIPIYLYNGKRGRNLKWVFYLFYPGHILLLYLISCALGLGHIVLIV